MKRLWCKLFHRRISWPVNGKYECWVCGQVYPVDWQVPASNFINDWFERWMQKENECHD